MIIQKSEEEEAMALISVMRGGEGGKKEDFLVRTYFFVSF